MLRKIKYMRKLKTEQRALESHAPKIGDPAPDFTLRDPTGERSIKLSELIGVRPVVLVFGSFT